MPGEAGKPAEQYAMLRGKFALARRDVLFRLAALMSGVAIGAQARAQSAPGAGAPGGDAAPVAPPVTPPAAPRAVLYQEDANDPQGKRYDGTVSWSVDQRAPRPGAAVEFVLGADIVIPEPQMTVKWELRRNSDPALPASHTIEVMFKLPADSPHGGVANVPGLLMKQNPQQRGNRLAALSVKVTNNYFLIGLSQNIVEVQQNLSLLKERPWCEIALIYDDGRRAVVAFEKGEAGERDLNQVLAAWK